jgi:hypothetical protein
MMRTNVPVADRVAKAARRGRAEEHAADRVFRTRPRRPLAVRAAMESVC